MMEFINSAIGYVVPVATLLGAILLVVENSKKLAVKPLSKLFGFMKKDNEDIKEIKECIEKIKSNVEEMGTKIDDNEKDRIRTEIFKYGRFARKNQRIEPEEWRHIQDVYYKYHDELKGNGQITEEYNVIKSHYEGSNGKKKTRSTN